MDVAAAAIYTTENQLKRTHPSAAQTGARLSGGRCAQPLEEERTLLGRGNFRVNIRSSLGRVAFGFRETTLRWLQIEAQMHVAVTDE